MNKVKGQSVCTGCKYSKLHYCEKYGCVCTSMWLIDNRYQIACDECKKQDGFETGTPSREKKPEKVGYFHLPGIENLNMWLSLMVLYRKYPEIFIPNRIPYEVYGSYVGAIWNGRTPNMYGEFKPIQGVIEDRNVVEENGLRINLTWNNHLVKDNYLYDAYCNEITKVFHNGKHSITVASPELFIYLKDNYPNFNYYQSVIQTEYVDSFKKLDPDKYKYDSYLMKRNWNNDWENLLTVPEEERDKYEFLCNDACTPICVRRGHYDHVNKNHLECSFDTLPNSYCTIDHDFMLFNMRKWPMTINPEHIDKYIENGFCHFKLCSRGDKPSVLAMKVLEYLVKPEYLMDSFIWVDSNLDETEYERKSRA